MRLIKFIVWHCTGGRQGQTIESILRYWREDKKWKNPGYHWIIKADGTVVALLPIEKISNGVEGHNRYCINIGYIGGAKGDDRTKAQKRSMAKLALQMREQFPDAEFRGHTDFPGVTKDCPSFNVKQWADQLGI